MRLSNKFYFRVAVLSLLLNIVTGGCEDDPVGLADRSKIVDIKFTSSSSFNANSPASNARLNYTGGSSWCASSSDSIPYLEVDLGSVYILCAVATQGNSQADQWVKTYEIKSSEDRSSWTPYKENGENVVFQGNYDRTTEVKHLLFEGIHTRYVRVYPKTHHGLVCLRFELVGKSKTDCTSSAIGVADSSKIPNARFTASSTYNRHIYKPWFARLNGNYGWTPATLANVANEWLEIDLGSTYFICGVATQGFNGEFNKKYKLQLSSNSKDWTYYTEGGTDREFAGNINSNDVVKNSLLDVAFGKFLRFKPKEYYGWPSLKMEVYGIARVCGSSLGMENRAIPDSQITASTGTGSNGRLYNTGSAWCGTTPPSDYLQVDLGQSVTVTGLATQGDPNANNWVTEYYIKYSRDSITWYEYKESGQTKKSFDGNSDQNSVFVNWLRYSVSAQYIRIYPNLTNGDPCMRVDLYGCVHLAAPTVEVTDKTQSSTSGKVSFTCNVTGNPNPLISWEYDSADVTSQSRIVTQPSDAVNSVTTSQLDVNVSDINGVLSKYKCRRPDPSTRDVECTSPLYLCKARYSGGPYSVQTATVVTHLAVPSAPTVTIGRIQVSSVFISWTHSQSSLDPLKEKPVKSFKVTISVSDKPDDIELFEKNEKSYVIKNPVLFKTYTVKVVAVSDVGEGLVGSATFNTDFPPTPSSISLSKQYGRSVVVTWVQPPSSAGQGAVTSFKIDYTESKDPSTIRSVNTPDSSARSATLIGLRLATDYDVKVTPFSARGAGVWLSKSIRTQARCDSVPIAVTEWSSSKDPISPPAHGQLNYTAGSSWCASLNDPSPYLEIDLGSDYIICAVVTQGNFQGDQWVKTYQVQTSKDGTSWSDYKKDGHIQVFDGNYDRSTEVKHINYGVMQGRHLRILPKSHYGGTCLRLAVYGVSTQVCSGTAIGVQSNLAVPDHRFTASSYYDSRYLPHLARLDRTVNGGWTSTDGDRATSWLQIDLGDVNVICAVTTQGRYYNYEWTKEYKLSLSLNNNSWPIYNEQGREKVFTGNTNHNGKKNNKLLEAAEAKLIRFKPVSYKNWPVLRVEVYGIFQACRHSLGLEDGSISDSSLSASSGIATSGRLYNTSSWSASSSHEYLQINLGGVKTLTGIATQGDPGGSKYVTSYSVSFSEDGRSWEEYKDSANSKTIIHRSNMEKLEVNWITNPLTTTYIRVFPETSIGGNCLRLDLYGCDSVVAKPSVSFEDLFVPSFQSTVNLICTITGQPRPEVKWQFKGNSISSSESTTNVIITSTHTVSYINAASVLSDHVCSRVNISTRHVKCSSPPYVCKARYTGGMFTGKSAVVIVNLLAPDAVIDLAVESFNENSATLKWSQPTGGDMPVTFYKLEYSESVDGATTKTTTTTATSDLVTGLKPYTNYTIRVMAKSVVGEGLWSALIQFTTKQSAPSKPTSLVIIPYPNHPRVNISWNAPTSPNGVINHYTVYYRYLPNGNVSIVNVTAGIMTVTVDIIGGMKYQFEVTATTVAEGAKVIAGKLFPQYAPDAAPGNFVFRHFNATTYNCSWDPPPRERSHGTITKYDVSYTSQPTTRRKRSSDAVSVTTTNTHIMLYNLVLCKRFNISVRAWTSAGPGPYSKERSLENAAMPPQEVKASETGSKKVEVTWTEPPRLGGEIQGYKVKYRGTKSYNDSFLHEGEQETSTREPKQLVVVGLVPGTDYEFEVATKAGCSEVAYSVVKARAETDVANPLPATVKLMNDANAGTQFTVTFSAAEKRNGPISSYQIIVLRVEGEVTALPENYENKLNNVTEAEALELPFYISAEIPEKNVTSNTAFVIGDETIYGSYLNARLRGGTKYSVFVRTITVYNGKMYASGPAKLAEITVRRESTSSERKDGGPVSAIVGVVVTILLVLVIAVLVVIYLRRRKNSEEGRHSSGKQTVPMHSLESQANGSSSLHLVTNEDDNGLRAKKAVDMVTKVKPETSKASPKTIDGLKVPQNDDSQAIYSNAMGEEERKAIPVVQFSEYMNRVKLGDYAHLRQEYQTFPKLQQFPWTEAAKPANKKFNRYGNIIAYDHTRVILEDYDETDYINANYIHGWDGTPQVYIATQGPVQTSVASFWYMIWNHNVSTIVMTTNLMEGGKKKCFKYWPDSNAAHGQLEVTLVKSDVFADFTIRTLKLSKGSESRNVTHFHFTVWPDHGVPRLPSNIISLRRRVKSKTKRDAGPIVVHCSAGVGRTGTYIVIDAMLEQAKKEKKVDIYSYLTLIRNDRIHMVQTEDQYVFIHKAILEALTCGNTELDLRKHNVRLVLKKLENVNQTHGKTGFEMEFERLSFVCPDASPDECEAAHRPENKSKNLNLTFAPLDISRVILSRPAYGESNDYINASFADAFRERNAFIMTQAPLPHTKEDFWQTVYQSSIGCIVMLNSLKEDSESYPKYWPSATSTDKTFGNITVSLQTEDVVGDVVKRKFRVSESQGKEQPLIVRHLHYTAWPDHSVPKNHLSVLKLLTEVQNAAQSSGKIDMVVHCSDGVGRSGTFCAIYSILERVKLEQVLDVFQAIKDIRVRRPSAVETREQYKFCYQIVQAYLDSFSDYANFSDC